MSIGDKAGADEVTDAINAITEKEIGVHLDIEWIESGSWIQQMNLKMSSREPVDLIITAPFMTFASMLDQNQLMDISGYLEEYGQDLLATMPEEYIDSVSVGSAIYGVPMKMVKQDSIYIAMRTDILEELGLTEQAQNMSSWTEFESILETVKENTDLVPLYCYTEGNVTVTYPDYVDVSDDDWSKATSLDNLGDSYSMIYVDENGQVCSYYQYDIFKADMERATDFYNRGLLYRDGATTETGVYDAFANNICFAALVGCSDLKPEEAVEQQSRKDLTVVRMVPETTTTFLVNMWSYAVPFTSTEPEAAVKFLNLLYTNADVVNLFTWGIQDRDYTLNEDGTLEPTQTPAYTSQSWLHGNTLLAYPTTANGPDYQEEAQKVIDSQNYSKYLGFICDTSSITNELTACNNAKQEFAYSLLAGSMPDYEQAYEEFMTRLENSGMDKILECYQTQLDEWVAQQGQE